MTPPGPGVATAAAVATLVVAALVLLLLLTIAVTHVRGTAARAREARLRAELTPLVHDLLDDAAPSPAATGAPALLDTLLLDLVGRLRGADRRALQEVLVARGVVDRAARDLTARRAWRRGRAATLLGSAGSTPHVRALVGLLGDRSAEVRGAAARALGKAGDAGAVGPLLATLSAGAGLPPGVVGMAVLDLGSPALPALREALGTASPAARALAAELLGLHGDASAVPVLEALLRDREQAPDVRRAAAAALGRIGSRAATASLALVLHITPWPELRRTAAEALGRIGDPLGIPVLRDGCGADDPDVRAACADALCAMGVEGRAALTDLATGSGAAAGAARAALEAVELPSRPSLRMVS
ncbi:HEAT repeat domain-containing protein [Geodermatophilus sp. YIM 151500]|uniref:HEAT repeat domain-containing protein n=1 Tax=Geodermatophilus sp. YIM 151500 TaxID=2984531 RepID=UPI0021E4B14F|nr:HEAT repeat domain-containing protein [Geodermatophilus sp. YIM 151500]MCV2490584.1 HEAT repeat domain-containing protein [Geodermatophilus sp. YIM 151500]